MAYAYPMIIECGYLFASSVICWENSRAGGIIATATPEQSSQAEART
jgi:hypothetical protein